MNQDGYSDIFGSVRNNQRSPLVGVSGIRARIAEAMPVYACSADPQADTGDDDVMGELLAMGAMTVFSQALTDWQMSGRYVIELSDGKATHLPLSGFSSIKRINPSLYPQPLETVAATGEVVRWRINQDEYHSSRLIVAKTDAPYILQVEKNICAYEEAVWHLGGLLERAQQAVYSVPDLGLYLSTADGEASVRKRVEMIDGYRSVRNMVAIDGAEKFDVLSPSISGATDIVSKMEDALCAAAGIPKTILFGTSSTGLATGNADTARWAMRVAGFQKQYLLPIIRRCLLALGAVDPVITFESIIQPEMKDQAQAFSQLSAMAVQLVDSGIIDVVEAQQILVRAGIINQAEAPAKDEP